MNEVYDMKSKKYFYEYDEYEDGNKDAKTMVTEILEDPELSNLEEIVIGCWGECYDNSVQSIIDKMVENKDKLQHIKGFFIGDMDYEECEVSWIEQGDYQKFWSAFPTLEKLVIKGSQNLTLGKIEHNHLKSLEIICGGLPKVVLNELAESKLPQLEKLNLYIGVENYGFDGELADIQKVVENTSFTNLKYLGIGDSEIQDEIVEVVLQSELVKQLEGLEFSNGTLSDQGAQSLLNHKDKLSSLKVLDLHYHFLSDKMMRKVAQLVERVNLDEQQANDEEYGNFPMLTE